MIVIFSIIFLFLLLCLYLLALLIEMHSNQQILSEVTITEVVEVKNKITRTTRKGYYLINRLWQQGSIYSSKKVRSIFLKIFPSAAHALKDRDLLTGLSSGPSSYFLSEISPDKAVNKIRRKKKSV